MTESEAVAAVMSEVYRAQELHPHWPKDIIHQSSIVCEESGELIRAALRVTYEGGIPDEVKTEAIQTAATCMRLLMSNHFPDATK